MPRGTLALGRTRSRERDGLPAIVVVVVFLAALLGRESPACAAPSAKLVYARGSKTATCPDEAAFRAAVAARVGYDPFFPFARRSVVTRIDDIAPAGFRARMEILDEQGALLGEKVFVSNGGDCTELVLTLALAVSLAIDVIDVPPPRAEEARPAAATAAEDVTGEPPLAAPIRALPPTVPPEGSAPAPRSGARWSGEGSVRAVGTVGLGPTPNVGVTVGGAIRRGAWSVGLEGRLDPATSASVEPRGSVSTSLLALSIAPCLAPYKALFACTFATAGSLAVSSAGIEHPARDTAFFLALGARLGVEIEATSVLALRAALDLAAVPVRHAVRVGPDDVYESSIVMASANLGAVVRF